jgi:hypothetical protein
MEQTATPKQLRSFGCLMGGMCLLFALWPLVIHGRPGRWWALMIGAGLLVPALVMPRLLAPLYAGWMKLGAWMSWINTRLILAIGFFGLVTPIALVRRVCGKDSMRRMFNAELTTYRLPRSARPGSHLYRQY